MILSIFSNGLWAIHAMFYIPMILLAYFGYKSSNSGTIWGGSSSDMQIHESDEKFPIWKTWQFKFLYILVAVYVLAIVTGAFE